MNKYYHDKEKQPTTPPQPPFAPPSGTSREESGGTSDTSTATVQQQSQSQEVGSYAIDPDAIRPCTFRCVYLWLNTGERFWAWLVFVGPRSVAGWRWIECRWVYFGVDLNKIESFICN